MAAVKGICDLHWDLKYVSRPAFAHIQTWSGSHRILCKNCLNRTLDIADILEWMEPRKMELL